MQSFQVVLSLYLVLIVCVNIRACVNVRKHMRVRARVDRCEALPANRKTKSAKSSKDDTMCGILRSSAPTMSLSLRARLTKRMVLSTFNIRSTRSTWHKDMSFKRCGLTVQDVR